MQYLLLSTATMVRMYVCMYACARARACVACRDSAFGIVTRYGLDGRGIESPVGARFSPRSGQDGGGGRPDRTWGPPSLLCNGYRVSFPGVKRPGRGVNFPPASSAEVKDSTSPHLNLHDLSYGV